MAKVWLFFSEGREYFAASLGPFGSREDFDRCPLIIKFTLFLQLEHVLAFSPNADRLVCYLGYRHIPDKSEGNNKI